jgi:ATP-dependent DNA ligase
MPATYIVFDLLYESHESIMSHSLVERRKKLQRLVRAAQAPRLVLSEGVVGRGKAFFEEVHRRGLEGMVAKRLRSRYLPGKRTDAWTKVKKAASAACAVIGFLPAGGRDFRSLILAIETGGTLQCAGQVGTGFDAAMRTRLNQLLWSRLQEKPIIPCKIRGRWIKPGLYCKVRYLEKTIGGEFRAPVFEALYDEE